MMQLTQSARELLVRTTLLAEALFPREVLLALVDPCALSHGPTQDQADAAIEDLICHDLLLAHNTTFTVTLSGRATATVWPLTDEDYAAVMKALAAVADYYLTRQHRDSVASSLLAEHMRAVCNAPCARWGLPAAKFWGSYANLLEAHGQFDSAIDAYGRALSIYENGTRLSDVILDLRRRLIHVLVVQDRLDEATEHMREIVKAFSTTPNGALSGVIRDIGQVALERGQASIASGCALQALALDEPLFGALHPAVIANLNVLGSAHALAGNCADAQQIFQRAYDAAIVTLGAEHALTATLRAKTALG